MSYYRKRIKVSGYTRKKPKTKNVSPYFRNQRFKRDKLGLKPKVLKIPKEKKVLTLPKPEKKKFGSVESIDKAYGLEYYVLIIDENGMVYTYLRNEKALYVRTGYGTIGFKGFQVADLLKEGSLLIEVWNKESIKNVYVKGNKLVHREWIKKTK